MHFSLFLKLNLKKNFYYETRLRPDFRRRAHAIRLLGTRDGPIRRCCKSMETHEDLLVRLRSARNSFRFRKRLVPHCHINIRVHRGRHSTDRTTGNKK